MVYVIHCQGWAPVGVPTPTLELDTLRLVWRRDVHFQFKCPNSFFQPRRPFFEQTTHTACFQSSPNTQNSYCSSQHTVIMSFSDPGSDQGFHLRRAKDYYDKVKGSVHTAKLQLALANFKYVR